MVIIKYLTLLALPFLFTSCGALTSPVVKGAQARDHGDGDQGTGDDHLDASTAEG